MNIFYSFVCFIYSIEMRKYYEAIETINRNNVFFIGFILSDKKQNNMCVILKKVKVKIYKNKNIHIILQINL